MQDLLRRRHDLTSHARSATLAALPLILSPRHALDRKPALASLHLAVALFGFAALFGKWIALPATVIVLGGSASHAPNSPAKPNSATARCSEARA